MNQLMLGQLFALSCAVFWALAVMMFRRAGESLPAFELNLVKNAVSLVLLVPTVAWIDGFSLPAFPATDIAVCLLSGFLGIAVADTWYLRALNLMGASRTGIVASMFSPFVILLSAVFLDESLVGWQIAGFALVMSGILLVTWQRNRSGIGGQDIRQGVLYALGAVFMMAVGIVMVKAILEAQPFLWTVVFRFLGGVGGMVLYVLLRRRRAQVYAHLRRPQPWLWILLGSFIGSYISMLLWIGGYKLIPASQASILNETASAWIVLFAWLMLGEGLDRRRVAGLVLTFAGVGVMLLV